MQNGKIEQVINTLDSLPSPAGVVARILHLCDSSDTNFDDFARVVESDPALTAKILKTVRSAYYNHPDIKNIRHSLSILGINTIKQMALSLTTKHFLKSKYQKYSRYYQKKSLLTAVIAENLARISVKREILFPAYDYMFLLGLIHNIGNIILLEFFHEDFLKIRNLAHNHSLTVIDSEFRIMGISHPQIGAVLAQQWDFPDSLVIPIQFHHAPQNLPGNNSEYKKPTFMLYLANNLAKNRAIETVCNEPDRLKKYQNLLTMLSLEKDDFNWSLLEKIDKEYESFASLYD